MKDKFDFDVKEIEDSDHTLGYRVAASGDKKDKKSFFYENRKFFSVLMMAATLSASGAAWQYLKGPISVSVTFALIFLAKYFWNKSKG